MIQQDSRFGIMYFIFLQPAFDNIYMLRVRSSITKHKIFNTCTANKVGLRREDASSKGGYPPEVRFLADIGNMGGLPLTNARTFGALLIL